MDLDVCLEGSPDIQIGEVYEVLRSSGQYYPATIIESRINSAGGNKEYYVHYCNQDRRLDEWVTEERISYSAKLKSSESIDCLSNSIGNDIRFTRNQKRKLKETIKVHQESDSLDSTTQKLELEHQEFTRVKFIDQIQFGKYEIDTWYFSPYPEECRQVKKLWICEYCLKYMKYCETWLKHVQYTCKMKHPPGKEIYNHGNLCVYELDGNVQKEKVSADNYNLACILTLPPFQRRGYGHFLISLSYELAKIEQVVGTPEKPLSDLGRLSYRSYWEKVILNYFLEHSDCTMNEISKNTCIAIDDIIWTLQNHPVITNWQYGQHIHIQRDIVQQYLDQLNEQHSAKLCFHTDSSKHRKMNKNAYLLDINHLKWEPSTKRNNNNNSNNKEVKYH
uniref:Histone acetyltransferase n=1 Tax=Trichobilharzia regenti TaxID=157069 RepID=A0AA85KCJ4_TRIRE|nr:unnamed protein product [Trichobilharzia regenti]